MQDRARTKNSSSKIRFETLRTPASIPSRKRDALRAKILELNLSLSQEPAFIHNWHARIDTFLETTDVLDLAWQGESLVGHYGARHIQLDDTTITYIDSFTVAPHLQRSGLGKRLALRSNLRAILSNPLGITYHASRTSNPHVAAGVWRGLLDPRHYYPSYNPDKPSTEELTALATQLWQALWADKHFDPTTGVLAAAYGGSFIETQPTRQDDVARHFDAHVDAERGDAIIQIVRFSPGTWFQLARYFLTQLT